MYSYVSCHEHLMTVQGFITSWPHLIMRSTLSHGDDAAILCDIGHEVVHVIRRIYAILTTPTNG